MFKDKLAKGLLENSTLDSHIAIRGRLDEMLARKLNTIKESGDDRNAALEVKMAAKSFSGEDADDHNGVIIVYFKSKQGASDFSDWLEGQEVVETYEMNTLPQVTTGIHPNIVDLESFTDDHQCNFQVIVYLYPEYTVFDSDYDGDGDEDEADVAIASGDEDEFDDLGEEVQYSGEQIQEVLRKIRINARGVKSIKMKCSQGFKWDPTLKACVKIGGQELSIMRKSSRRALITKKAMGSSFKVRVKRRILRAFKFRKMMGLKV